MDEFFTNPATWIITGATVSFLTAFFKLVKWSGGVDKSVDNINIGINRLETKIDSMDSVLKQLLLSSTTFLQPTDTGRVSQSVTSNSPLTLTKKGAEGAAALGAEDVAERLAKSISLPPDVSKLRIQDACHHAIFTNWRNLFSDDEIAKIEEHTYEDGGNMADTLLIYAIVTRNHILRERGFDVPEYQSEETTE